MDSIYICSDPKKVPDQHKNHILDKMYINNIADSSCKNLYIDGAFYSEEEIGRNVKKLRHGGQITLSGPDLQEISRCVLSGYLKPENLRKMLGHDEKLYTCREIVNFLTNAGLKIIHKRVNNFRYCITAERK